MKEKIYLSGKISGLPHEEAEAKFRLAEQEVGEWAEAINPMALDVNIHPSNDEPDWCDYMLTDLDILMRQCTGIYMLRDWRDSKGAKIEHAIAEIMGLAIYYEATR